MGCSNVIRPQSFVGPKVELRGVWVLSLKSVLVLSWFRTLILLTVSFLRTSSRCLVRFNCVFLQKNKIIKILRRNSIQTNVLTLLKDIFNPIGGQKICHCQPVVLFIQQTTVSIRNIHFAEHSESFKVSQKMAWLYKVQQISPFWKNAIAFSIGCHKFVPIHKTGWLRLCFCWGPKERHSAKAQSYQACRQQSCFWNIQKTIMSFKTIHTLRTKVSVNAVFMT